MFEYSNICIPFEYLNTISEFENLHFFICPRAVLLLCFQIKKYTPALKGGFDNLPI